MTAAGVLVAGGLMSCSDGDVDSNTKNQYLGGELPYHPSETITVRVRVGKSRDRSGIVINDQRVERTTRGWVVSGDANRFTIEENGISIFSVHRDTHTLAVAGNPKQFTGQVSMHAREDVSEHAFDVVAHVPMEMYLPGVVAGELFSHWHLATFAAQAVAARSYATSQHLLRKTTSHFDVTDGPSSQVFLGDVTLDVAHRAVQETEGVVLTWKDKVVPSYYSACCGGLPAKASDAIGPSKMHGIPPLQGHDGEDACTELAVHKWVVERPHRYFYKRITQWAGTANINSLKGLRSIRSIVPVQANQHGRPVELEILDRRRKSFAIKARHFVRAANFDISSLPAPMPRVWSSNLVASKEGTKVELSGVGMGHGVGMCQYGAQVLAGQGETWEKILSWYYPHAKLV